MRNENLTSLGVRGKKEGLYKALVLHKCELVQSLYRQRRKELLAPCSPIDLALRPAL